MRIKWIDFAKGAGILLVVYVHATFYSGFYFSKWINSFFMPLFFICAGLVFSYQRFSVKKTAATLLGAYYIWGIIGLLFGTSVDLISSSFSEFGCNTLNLLFGIKSYYNSPLWFLTSLFTAKIFYWLVCRAAKNRHFIKLLLILILTSAGILINYFKKGLFLPYRFDIGMAMIVFIYIGELSKNGLKKIADLKNRNIFFVFAASLFINILSGVVLNGEVSVDAGIYSFFPLLLISACFGALSILTAGMLLTHKDNVLGNVLCRFGNRSLTIQCSHVLVLFVLSAALSLTGLPVVLIYCIKYVLCLFAVLVICNLTLGIKKKLLKVNRFKV